MGMVKGSWTGMIRTPQNCKIADKIYDRDDPERYENGKCVGVRKAVGYDSDEPIEICKECKCCVCYEE